MKTNRFNRFELLPYESTLIFGHNQSNRVINHGHLQKIKSEMACCLETMPPITVNTLTNNVIDGQHRLKAFQTLVRDGVLPKDALIKVMFVDINLNEEKKAIVNANTTSKNWSMDDYIRSYAKEGMLPYIRLEEWCRDHVLCNKFSEDKETGGQRKIYNYRYGAAILTGKRCSSELKSATFNFTDEQSEIGHEIHAEMLEILDIFGIKNGPCIESLAITWHEYRQLHDFNVWMKELKAKKARFQKMPKNNLNEWEAIFNTAHGAISKKCA